MLTELPSELEAGAAPGERSVPWDAVSPLPRTALRANEWVLGLLLANDVV